MGDMPVSHDELLGGVGRGVLLDSTAGVGGVGCLDVLDPLSFLRGGAIEDAIGAVGHPAASAGRGPGDSTLWVSGTSDSGGHGLGGGDIGGGGIGSGSGGGAATDARGAGLPALTSNASLDWGWPDLAAEGDAAGTHRWPVGSAAEALGPGCSVLGDLRPPLASALAGGKGARGDPLASTGSLSQWFLPGATAAAEAMAGTVEVAAAPPPRAPTLVAGASSLNYNADTPPLFAATSATTGRVAPRAAASTVTAAPRVAALATASPATGLIGAKAVPNVANWIADHTSGGTKAAAPTPTAVAPRPPSCSGRSRGSSSSSDSPPFSLITGASTGSDGSSENLLKASSTAAAPHRRKAACPAKRPRSALPPPSRQQRPRFTAPAPAVSAPAPAAAAQAPLPQPAPPLVTPLAAAAAGALPAKPPSAPVAVTAVQQVAVGRRRSTSGSGGAPIPATPVAAAPATAGGVASAPAVDGVLLLPPPLHRASPTVAGTAALSSTFSAWFGRSRAALLAATDATASAATAAAAAAAAAASTNPPGAPPPTPAAPVALTLLATELTLYANALGALLPAVVPWLPHPAVVEAYQMDATAHAASAAGLVRLAAVDAAGAFLAAHQLAVVVEAHTEKMSVHLLPLAGQAVGGEALQALAAAIAPPPGVATAAAGGLYSPVGQLPRGADAPRGGGVCAAE